MLYRVSPRVEESEGAEEESGDEEEVEEKKEVKEDDRNARSLARIRAPCTSPSSSLSLPGAYTLALMRLPQVMSSLAKCSGASLWFTSVALLTI
jgi:hypothetical protein